MGKQLRLSQVAGSDLALKRRNRESRSQLGLVSNLLSTPFFKTVVLNSSSSRSALLIVAFMARFMALTIISKIPPKCEASGGLKYHVIPDDIGLKTKPVCFETFSID